MSANHAQTVPGLACALQQWRGALGPDCVATDDLAWYEGSTSGLPKAIPAVLRPRSAEAIPALVTIAAANRTPITPISTGRNWGYGAAHPVRDGCVVVDLSGLDRIRAFDAELGLVTLEPGVTQAQLAAFLLANDHPFMVPTTGAGPSCSILANALERGFGLSPNCDHFAAVTGIEAVMPDGSVYRSPLQDLGAHRAAGAYKWGFGPYLDGLFAQSGFGIVTAMTLALAKRPDAVRLVLFQLRDKEDIARAADCVRRIMQDFPGIVSSVKLSNRALVMATTQPYPAEDSREGVVSTAALMRFGRAHGLGEWLGIAAIHGTRAIAVAAARGVRQRLERHATRFVTLSPARLRLAERGIGLLGRFSPIALAQKLSVLRRTFALASGRPDDIALSLAYWRSPSARASAVRDPARDGCGILWYAPILPIEARIAVRFHDMVDRVMREHRFEPLVTFTTVSAAAFDSTIPILFDPASPDEVRRAHACHEALLNEGLALGLAPYRYGVQAMDWLERRAPGFLGLVGELKHAVDPAGILAPGRYAPLSRRSRDGDP